MQLYSRKGVRSLWMVCVRGCVRGLKRASGNRLNDREVVRSTRGVLSLRYDNDAAEREEPVNSRP